MVQKENTMSTPKILGWAGARRRSRRGGVGTPSAFGTSRKFEMESLYINQNIGIEFGGRLTMLSDNT
jgi:hypothetical protein